MVELELVALKGVKRMAKVHEVIVPTPDGQIAIFADHMPLVTVAVAGVEFVVDVQPAIRNPHNKRPIKILYIFIRSI